MNLSVLLAVMELLDVQGRDVRLNSDELADRSDIKQRDVVVGRKHSPSPVAHISKEAIYEPSRGCGPRTRRLKFCSGPKDASSASNAVRSSASLFMAFILLACPVLTLSLPPDWLRPPLNLSVMP